MKHQTLYTKTGNRLGIRFLAACCAVFMLLSVPWQPYPAARAEDAARDFFSASSTGGMSNTEAARGFIEQYMLSGSGAVTSPKYDSLTVSKLTQYERALYDALKEMAQKLARGELATAVLTLPLKTLAPDQTCTAQDLGVPAISSNGTDLDYGVEDAFLKKYWVNVQNVHDALLIDCPYDLYWYDKTTGTNSDIPCFSFTATSISFADYNTATVSFRMAVAKEYSASNTTGTTQLNTVFGQALKKAAVNIPAIVSENASKGDVQKLTAYKDKILALVDYNDAAASDSSMPYGNPWQLIWIFDGDPSTKVVCEGYSKGFQYLCDLSTFKGSVACVSVYGELGGAGAHMWNIVTLQGKRYLADLTNSDYYESLGCPGELFLEGYSGRQAGAAGQYIYYYTIANGDVLYYVYDTEMAGLFGTDELMLTDQDFDPDSEGQNKEEEKKEEEQKQEEEQKPEEEKQEEEVPPILIPVGRRGWIRVADGSWMYGKDDGYAAIGPMAVDGAWYCFDERGKMITGWAEVQGKWYYASSSGALYRRTWAEIGGDWYYFGDSGEMATGWQKIGGATYYFKASGVMATGWQKAGNAWYYLSSSGAMRTGWLEDGGAWYYMSSSGAMATGWVQDGGAWYYMSSSGVMATGWVKDNGAWYYLAPSGARRTGWLQDGGSWYYLDGTGAMVTGWVKSGNSWFYMSSSGTMATGWLKLSGEWHNFGDDGAMKTGWQKIDDVWYYMDENGVMQTGEVTINGRIHLFGEDGAWLRME